VNPISKSQQLSYRRKRKPRQNRDGYDGPESDLQSQMDDLLVKAGIEFRRIPDGLWAYLKMHAPARMIKQLTWCFKGKPDTLILVPIPGTPYSLAREVEIKNKNGEMSKEQAAYAERMPVTVSRSTADNERAVLETMAEAQRLGK